MNGRDYLENLAVYVGIILKWILNKCLRMWTGFTWHTVEGQGRVIVNTAMNIRILWKTGSFLIRWETISFRRTILLRGLRTKQLWQVPVAATDFCVSQQEGLHWTDQQGSTVQRKFSTTCNLKLNLGFQKKLVAFLECEASCVFFHTFTDWLSRTSM